MRLHDDGTPMTKRLTAANIISHFGLQPLEGEGGYFRQTWFSGSVEAPDATAIYYLITPESFSSLHRLAFPEIFHFYAGDPCEMVQLSATGELTRHTLGIDFAANHLPQIVVPAQAWQGTRLVAGGSWALIGTTMSPGFHPGIFESATRDDLNGMDEDTRAVLDAFLAWE
jgi:predicted cupin superfamily sugar epimerase